MRNQSFNIFAVALLACALFAIPVQAAPMASLNLLDSDILIGESFDVQVWADGDGMGLDLLGFGFDVATTGGAFSYDGYTIGSGFDDVSDLDNPDNVAGFANAVISDDHVLLATLSFYGGAEGSGGLSVAGPYDERFYGLYYELAFPDFGITGYDIEASIDISVSGTAPVPEPATILLLTTGALGMGVFGRKKFRIKK